VSIGKRGAVAVARGRRWSWRCSGTREVDRHVSNVGHGQKPVAGKCGSAAEKDGHVCIRVGGTSFRLLVKINCLNFVYVVLKNCFISFKLDGYIYLPRLLSPFTF
jgi:hypothetical protein